MTAGGVNGNGHARAVQGVYGDDAVDALVGERVGRYVVDSLLVVGGMSKVYCATTSDGTRVALKVAKRDVAADQTFRSRFAREARIARTVSHPHLVPVLDSGEHDGMPYLAQRFIDGQSLEEKLRQRPLDLPTTIEICTQLSGALDTLWAAGMVHRDVKPGNILLDQAQIAYLTDFGLAKDYQDGALTQSGESLGSLDYMAPEQIRAEPATAAADIYSLGCVIFECLQGKPPFAHRNRMRVLWAHLHDEPPDPGAGRPDVPPAVGEIVKEAMSKEPDERPGSCAEFARLLSEAAGDRLAKV